MRNEMRCQIVSHFGDKTRIQEDGKALRKHWLLVGTCLLI